MAPRQWLRRTLGVDTEEGRQAWDDRVAMLVGGIAALVIVVAAVAAVVMSIQIYRHPQIEATGNPLEPIFSSRLMIAAARLAVLAVGVYIVVSILIHMRRGQWLTAAGPFKVSGSLRALSSRATQRGDDVRLLLARDEQLTTRVKELTSELRTHEALLAQAQKRLAEKPNKGA